MECIHGKNGTYIVGKIISLECITCIESLKSNMESLFKEGWGKEVTELEKVQWEEFYERES